MRRLGVLWCTAVLIVAGAVGCGGDKGGSPDGGSPSLDGSRWTEDSGAFVNLRTDSDTDGIADFLERDSGDSDGDGTADYLDADDDGDGIATVDESGKDSDSDGVLDYLDDDDDGDGTPTRDELAAAGGASADSDADGVPDYLDDDRVIEVDAGVEKECAQSSAAADLRKKPVDIVFVIDNSSSMDSEIKAVQQSINADFASVIGASGIDFRVIMLADFGHYGGNARSVCISGGLNPSQSCPDDDGAAVYAQAPVHSERFFHYDPDGVAHDKNSSVGSRNSLCRAIEWFGKADGFNQAAQGWGSWLRKDAAKVFVEVTDDWTNCSVSMGSAGTVSFDDTEDEATEIAAAFDVALRTLSAEQFGGEGARNYVFHSIVSLPFKATMDTPYEAAEPVANQDCQSGENPGRTYEALSRLTGGLRYPVCAADPQAGGDTSGFTAIFQRIAQGVVEGSKVACDFAVPQAPAGKTLDLDTVEVVYTPASGDAISFRKVQDSEGCAGQNGSFFFRSGSIVLCSDTCTRVQSDATAKVDVRYGCKLPPRTEEPPPLPPPPTPE